MPLGLVCLLFFLSIFARATDLNDVHQLVKLKYTIQHKAKFQNVDSELSRYRNLAKKMGLEDSRIKQYTEKYEFISREQEKKEQKSCEQEYDYRSQLGPLRNQGNLYWCFAYASADLFSYKLGKEVSATDIAIKHYNSGLDNLQKFFGKDTTDFRGGYTSEALKETIINGVCLEKNFKSDNSNLIMAKKRLASIEAFKDQSAISPINTNKCLQEYSSALAIFPKVKLKDFTDIMQKSDINYIENLADKSCEPRVKLDQYKAISQTGDPQNPEESMQMFNTIDQQLENKNIVLINYNASILKPNSQNNHSSTVVGRKYNKEKKQCEYLIRNSWGASCKEYQIGIRCENGYIWMPKAELAKTLYRINYLE